MARGYCHKHWRAWRQHGDALYADRPRPRKKQKAAGRKYSLNEAFFDQVDDERKAYWLGFITADGNISQSYRSYALRVELSVRDQHHLDQMCADLGSNRPILFERACAVVSFGSRHMVESLGCLGITPRKSATVEPWDGPPGLMAHYWRGMFDGDGSIYMTRTSRNWAMTMCGSEACVRAFARWAGAICGSRAVPHHAKGGCWAWAVGGSRMAQRLADALYADASVALERKSILAAELRSLDFATKRIAANAQRAASMRDAWESGRHARSKVIPG